MAERKKTPDIMADLLGDKSASQQGDKTSNSQNVTSASQQGDKTLKVTFYLTPETLGRLESAQAKLRGMAKVEMRGQVTRSAMVETMLLTSLDEFETEGESSQLASKLLKR